jgi:ParB/RepB/Spo0J family partition protein
VKALRQLMGDSASAPQEAGPEAESTMGALQYESQIMQIALDALDRRSDNVRKSMDPQDLVALQASLAQQGMMHPVIVEPLPNKTRGFRYRLVAGYRRTAAAQALGWTHVPARVLTTPLTDEERTVLQMTENLQRESMRLRDVVHSVQALHQLGRSPAEMARQLGMSQSRLHLYQQLGDILQAQPKLWPYFDKGLISIEHFRAAQRLLTATRRKAGAVTTDPAVQAQIMEQAEHLFVSMIERLAQIQPLTMKRVSKEVVRLLDQAGVEAAAVKEPAPPSTIRPAAIFASFDHIAVDSLSRADLEQLVTIAQAKLDAAQARLATLS